MIKKLLFSTALFLFAASTTFAQYCEAPAVTLHSVDCNISGNGSITSVSIASTTLSNLSTGCPGNTYAYVYYTGLANYTATLTKGSTYTLSVTADVTNQDISVWIDYDQNQIFDASEWTQVAFNSTIGAANTVQITIPNSALTGSTRMRIRSRNTGFSNGSTDGCTTFGSGETEDYDVTIAGSGGGSGCIATSQYPAGTITGPTTNGQTVVVTPATGSTCNYSGEYGVLSLIAGNFTLTSSNPTDYFTVTNTANTVLFQGSTPLTFTIASAGTYHSHIFSSSGCVADNICRGVSITKNNVASTPPTVSTDVPSAITATSATCGGNVSSAGSATVTARGVCYATTLNPTTANSIVASGSGVGTFTANLTGLTAGTLYHVRAYATSSVGTSYGSDQTFTTGTAGCIATTLYPSNTITGPATNGASVVITPSTGSCNYAGEYAAVTIGIGSYTLSSSTTTDYLTVTTTGGVVIAYGPQPLTFSVSTAGTYWMHVHKDNLCTTESACRGLTILKNSSTTPPLVSTTAATAITAGGATTGGNVTSAGSATVTVRGVCYATTLNPTTANSTVTSGSGTGVFTANLTGLASGTLYHFRAYATSSAGTAYGNDLTFTTTAQALPSVITTAATGVTTTTANSGGNVTSIGSSAVTSRGICYATTANPTLANTVISGGSGAGAFTSNLTGLSPNTSYYIRAYATNSTGTAYGTQVTFTTVNPTPPSVSTTAATAVSYFTATAGGNVTNEGTSPVTDRGVCYSTTASPTIANSYVSGGSGSGVFTVNLSGLSGSTTYHFRAYATSSVGTSYGPDLIFTTLDPCVNSNEVYLTNLAFMDLATANATPTYYGTYVTPNAQGLPGLPTSLNYNSLNPYNLVNPGLPVRMKVKSYNNKTNGTSVVSGLCKLRTTDPNITIIDSTAGLNNVGWHNEAWSTDEFEFVVSYSVFTSYTAYVEVVIVEGPNQYYTKCIPIPIRAFTVANLDVDDDNNPDSNGNNNDIAEPSEVVEFLPYINNSSSFSASYVAGFIMNFDYLSNVAIWDNHVGSSGNVYAQGWWNFSFGQPQPIPAGTLNTLPEYDFVFDYTYPSTYRFDLHLMMAGGFNLLNSINNVTLMRTSTPLTFNANYTPIPPTSVVEQSKNNEISVYPNPFNHQIMINSLNANNRSNYFIINSIGEVVATGKLEGAKTTLQLDNLSSGLYTLQIQGQQGIKISKR